jgi:hypothetical protein
VKLKHLNHPNIPTNVFLYKIIKRPYILTLQHIEAIIHHPQGDVTQNCTKLTNPMCVGHKTHHYTTQELDPFGLNALILDVSMHITAYKTNSGTSFNCIEECQHHSYILIIQPTRCTNFSNLFLE